MVDCPMPLQIDDSKATHIFLPQPPDGRTCPACGEEQRYYYKSSGRYFYLRSGLKYLDGQIVCCHNGQCPLRFKPMHPPEELALVPPLKGHGFDVIASIGQSRYGEEFRRSEIKAQLARDFPLVEISERQIETLYKLYGQLVSGSTLKDPEVIAKIKANKVMVLSTDGAKPIRNNDSVWFVRDVVSGITLAAMAMTSCTKAALVKLLIPIKEFARRHNVHVVGIVSDKESKILAAVKQVFPKARHQYCQLHYVANLAKPLVKQDLELANEVRKEARGEVGKIEESTKENTGPGKSLNTAQAKVILRVCEGIRSVLRFPGRPPFEPPGLRLLEQLKTLRDLVHKMGREKGGPKSLHWPSFSPLWTSSSRPLTPSTSSTTTSGTCERSSSRRARLPRVPSAGSASSARAGNDVSGTLRALKTPRPQPCSKPGVIRRTPTGRVCFTATVISAFQPPTTKWRGSSKK